jgi:hypothetical protein
VDFYFFNIPTHAHTIYTLKSTKIHINPLNAELNPICHLLTLLEAYPIFHISGIRVKEDYSIVGAIVALYLRRMDGTKRHLHRISLF